MPRLQLFEADAYNADSEDPSHTFKLWARDYDDAWRLAYEYAREHLPPGNEVYVISFTGVTGDGHAEYPDA